MTELATATEDPAKRLTSVSFIGYLITQGLSAVNDSMFRWLIVPIAKFRISEQFGGDSGLRLTDSIVLNGTDLEAVALGMGLACFVLPFIIFAPYAGFLADRYSKRNVTIACKVAEIAIMALGLFGIWVGNIYFMYAVLFAMGTQSAMMSPSKMGLIPEIVSKDRVSAANGAVGLVTVISVVTGTVAGTTLYSMTGNYGTDGLWDVGGGFVGCGCGGLDRQSPDDEGSGRESAASVPEEPGRRIVPRYEVPVGQPRAVSRVVGHRVLLVGRSTRAIEHRRVRDRSDVDDSGERRTVPGCAFAGCRNR